MRSNWFSIVAFIAALLLGYLFINRDARDAPATTASTVAVADYYLKNAVIVETDANGAPRIRYMATTATQEVRTGAATMHGVQVDYVVHDNDGNTGDKPTPKSTHRPTHWVLTANTGYRAPQSDTINLTGNVQALSVSGSRNIRLAAQSLDVDIEKQRASTKDNARIDIDDSTVSGARLSVDLPREQAQISNGCEFRFATPRSSATSARNGIDVPNIFGCKSLDFDSKNNTLTLHEVRSKVPPFVSAEEAVAMGADLENNRFVLRGSVSFDLPQRGKLTADSAVVTIRDSRIVYAVVSGRSGQPIEFEHQPLAATAAETVVWRGRAQSIDFDVEANTLLMQRDVRLTRFLNNASQYEIDCPIGKYNLLSGDASCTKSDQARSHVNIEVPADKLELPTPKSTP